MTDAALATSVLPPVVKIVTVKAAPDLAFRRFTAEMASWWPLATHSIGQEDTETVEFEPRVGGRIVERIKGGREAVWGTVTAWDPPTRVAFTWHPGTDPATAGDVELRFSPEGAHTRVELIHSGFERLGAMGPKTRKAYGLGWIWVLGLYTRRKGLDMALLGALTDLMVAINRMKKSSKTA